MANDVSKPGQGFNSELNQVTVISTNGELALDLDQKDRLAEKIVAYITKQYLKL